VKNTISSPIRAENFPSLVSFKFVSPVDQQDADLFFSQFDMLPLQVTVNDTRYLV